MADISTVETLRSLAHGVKKQLAIQLEAEDLGLVPMQVRVMKTIDKCSPCTALDVANFLQRDKAQITRLVNGLLEQGLIEKVPNPQDKRSQFLLLSKEGGKIQQSLAKITKRAEKSMIAGIADEEMQSFLVIAQKMLKNVENK
ncbi:MarR family winged helix-turn-helix transcriptional regulator [Colwellia echini]|uniref:MarR family transcriptional regulator n=1 Tax=Colwellia echini TaxID=1982103 RepID=A0ABY3MZU1_9GAMM|nr:MarR family transcriptional regulator [Colwellia echini]TYK66740.1 MarR family transcriptional regulator [Colwellia echini]